MVPSVMGYATITGLPIQYGLYAAAVASRQRKSKGGTGNDRAKKWGKSKPRKLG